MTTAIRLTANEFLRKIREAEEGQVCSVLADGVDEIRLLVLKPEDGAGIFISPPATMFKSDEAFTKFVWEIESLTKTPNPLGDSRNRVIRRPDEPFIGPQLPPDDVLYRREPSMRVAREIFRNNASVLKSWLRESVDQQPDRYLGGGYYVRRGYDDQAVSVREYLEG